VLIRNESDSMESLSTNTKTKLDLTKLIVRFSQTLNKWMQR